MISLCMIVKNEIKYIEECLQAALPYVDEIVVADTGSTDGTLEILEKYGCRVYHFDWVNDYAKARNFAISKAKYNWILSLDGDEIIVEFDKEEVNKLVKSNYGEILGMVKNRSFIGDISKVRSTLLPRFFHKKYFSYQREIHEEPLPKFKFNETHVKLGITVNHFGYLDTTREEKGKGEKYEKDLLRSLENNYDPYIVMHLAGNYLNLKQFEKAIVEVDKIIADKSLYKRIYFVYAIIIKIKSLCGLNKYKEALEMQQFYDYCKHDHEYLYTMANVFRKNNLIDTALDIYTVLYYTKDLEISRLEPVLGIAEINFEKKNYEEALKWFNMLKNIDANITNKTNLCKLYISEKNI